ncbi:DNA topoisomerase 3-alpha-like [Sinocyclocheilus anshuiensis]|uniref:DNA topoisomerase 3-alpha-like n=1 Tax=Sinocyclocheilus anshuiensis TaxID=1608454 RepID=UPI0007B8CB1D|nr:PREDICTED: DNA topoisomerase 3-alpha-like [Sinocyclocheilus anshuiensis]
MRTLEREVRQCQALVIWTDCDREGENIGFEIIDVCKAVKPNVQVFRARFSEITPNSIRRACETLTEPDINISDAVDVRQELDLRIGASFTRFQTLRLQKIFPESLSDQLISYGSCQFPTLGFVVERFKAIQAFVPETFFKIKVVHEPNEEESVEFSWKRHRLFNHTACLVLYQMCMEDPMAKVISVTSKPKSKWRPLPLDTVELEKLASRKLRISAKETMKIAEKLYTQGFISYPRTETNMFPQNLNLTMLVEQQTQDNEWGNFAQRILESGGPTPRNGNKSDQAHPPIHPTKYTNSLQGNEKRLYEFIVRHFLACCSKDAQGQEVTVEIEIAEERFSASGLTIIARNYLEVYPYDKWYNKVNTAQNIT